MKKHLVWVILLVLLFSCRVPVEETYHFSGSQWNRFETVNYHAILEHTGDYDIKMILVYDKTVDSDPLTIGLTMEAPYDEERYLELDIPLFRDDKPLGEETDKEGQYQIIVPFFRELHLREQGLYEFRANLLINRYNLHGVHQLTLKLEPV